MWHDEAYALKRQNDLPPAAFAEKPHIQVEKATPMRSKCMKRGQDSMGGDPSFPKASRKENSHYEMRWSGIFLWESYGFGCPHRMVSTRAHGGWRPLFLADGRLWTGVQRKRLAQASHWRATGYDRGRSGPQCQGFEETPLAGRRSHWKFWTGEWLKDLKEPQVHRVCLPHHPPHTHQLSPVNGIRLQKSAYFPFFTSNSHAYPHSGSFSAQSSSHQANQPPLHGFYSCTTGSWVCSICKGHHMWQHHLFHQILFSVEILLGQLSEVVISEAY